jgi:hypothetical protein
MSFCQGASNRQKGLDGGHKKITKKLHLLQITVINIRHNIVTRRARILVAKDL